MIKNRLTVVIPSRKRDCQLEFLRRAVGSIREQSVAGQFDITILVGVDRGDVLDLSQAKALGVTCVESANHGQAAALNAAAQQVHDGFIAFLEDDDEWAPTFLQHATDAIRSCDFLSSTQLEYDERGTVLRINDFPTPSGWFMPIATFEMIGNFDESYRYHLDNNWLGRLNELRFKRVHLVESTAPVEIEYATQVRPWLTNIIKSCSGYCQLVRHNSPLPLVKRLVHRQSGMSAIAHDAKASERSLQECKRLIERFGAIPW